MIRVKPLSKGFSLAWMIGFLIACSPDIGGHAKSNQPVSIPVGESPSKGTPQALVTIVEFSDFQCPFCKRVTGTLKQIEKTYGDKVRIVFKHNPLPFHKDAPLAAQASLAAAKQGKFWEMHDKLFDNLRALKRPNLEKYAGEVGLNVDQFKADIDSDSVKRQVELDKKLAAKLKARGTPHFFINGKRLPGAVPFERFKTAIDAELKAVKGLIAQGKTVVQAYEQRVNANYEAPKPRKPRGGAADSKTVYNIQPGTSYAKGGAEPLVTIIEFSEFQCPFCTRVLPTMKKIMDTYGDKVRIVFKHNPLPFHKDAMPASKAALAAGEQGKFWEMHDVLFANQRKLKEADLMGYATQLGLNMDKFKADMANSKFEKMVKADQALAARFGARGTPGFFINGRNLRGAQPFAKFKALIDEELKKAEALVAKGTARKDVYKALTAKGKSKAAPAANRKRPAADTKTVYNIQPGTTSYAKGGAEPLVTIIEFSEFQCPFCSRVLPTMNKITETYGEDVQIVFKHNPLSFHKDAKPASKAALAAGEQGKFWEMHDLLFANQRKLKEADLMGYATKLGLNMEKFTADIKSDKFDKAIAADQALGAKFGARGTPGFFINGRNLRGAQPFDRFKTIIDEEIKKAKALIAKGTARKDIYKTLTAKGKSNAAPAARKAPPEDNKVYNVKINANDAIKGNPNAPVTIAEFSDFQCPFCSRVNPTIKKIFDTYGDKVRVVFKHNPLPFHKDAPLASEASLAAGAQGKFWEMHDLLFANQRKLKRADLDGYATQLGLNMAQFKADLDSRKYKAQVDADLAQSKAMGVRGTPNFFINGKKLTGAQPFARFKAKIDEALKGSKGKAKAAVPTAKLAVPPTAAPKQAVKPTLKAAMPKKPANKITPELLKAIKNIKANKGNKAKVSIPAGKSASKGSDQALVTIVEFSDFQCPFCKRVTGSLKKINETYGDKVRIVFKHNPLPFHKDAPLASQAAYAAQQQGKFWEMHDKIFENMRALKRADLEKYAQAVGLDMAKFKADIDSQAAKAQVKADQALAAKLQARGTPHFFVNGKRLPGALPFDRFKSVIDAELKATAALAQSGKSVADIYQARVDANYEAPKPRKPRKGAAQADSKTVYNIQPGKSYAKGGAEPLVTIIEFSEFQCPFCTRVLPTMKKIMDTYGDKVRIVFKHNPLPFHKDAMPASKAALAAGEQGKFWEMHDVLFANQRKLKEADLMGYATQLGLNMDKFKADMANSRFEKIVKADQALAARFGARGTPGFFINGRNLRGAQPFAKFKALIDEELKKAEALIAKGTARKDVYKALTGKGKTKAAPAAANRKRPAADTKTVYNIQPGVNSYAKGGTEPLVTIIEFSEFQCPFCSRVLPTLTKVFETYGNDVQVIFKHNPLSFHKDAKLASKAALAAGEQGKFWNMHDLLFANQRKLKEADLMGYATQLGLNMDKFKADLKNPRFDKEIAADQALGAKFGARGTPNFFINGRNLRGAQPFARFKTVIDEEMKKAKALIAKGTARKDVYKTLTAKGKNKVSAPARKAAPEDNKVYDVKIKAGDAIKGNPNAPVTIAEFSDFQCPFCSRVNPTIKKIFDTYGDKVRVVFKHNPLPFHKDAPLASEASLAAGAQGKFWEMHDLLFANQRKLKRADLDSYANQLGLNMTQFAADLDSRKYKAQVDADLAQAKSIGVRGTPNFFINGKKLTGAQPFERFKAKIDEALKGKK